MQQAETMKAMNAIRQMPEIGKSPELRASMPPLTHTAGDGSYCVKVCRDEKPSEETFFDTGTGAATMLGRTRVNEPGVSASLWRLHEDGHWHQVTI